MTRFVTLVLRFRFPILGLCLALTVGAAAMLGTAHIGSSLGKLFFGESPKFDRYLERVEEFASDRKLIREFCKGGTDLLHMLRSEVTGRIDALDVKVFYHQFRLGMYSVHPTVSLTRNIGFDGTGLHCGESDRFEVDLYEGDGEIRFSGDTVPDERIVKALWRFRSGSAMQRLARKARRGYRRLRRVYRRVV